MFNLFSIITAFFRKNSPRRNNKVGDGRKRLSLESLESREVLSTVAWSLGPSLPVGQTDVVAFVGPDGDLAVLGGTSTSVLQLSSTDTAWTAGNAIDTALKSPGVVKTSGGTVFLYGGLKGNSASEEGWNYDYFGGDHQNIENLNIPRGNFGAAIDSLDRAYAIGGLDDNNDVISSVERYDRLADQWDEIDPLPAPRQNAATTMDDEGYIYVFGGQSATGTNGIATTSYRYDTDTEVWDAVAPMPTGTIDSTAIFAPDGDIYVLGGRTAAGAVASVQIYDLDTNTWSAGTDLPAAVYNHASVVDDLGRIFVVGGTNSAGAAIATVTRSQRLDVPEVAPIITSNPVTSGSLDSVYSYDVNATGNPEATFSLVTAPAGMSIHPNTGLISWQPIEGQTGSQSVTIRAENRVGGVEQTFVINVLADTIAPTAPTALTMTSANTTSISLSWNPSTDNRGVDHYEVLEGFRSGWRGRNTTYRVVTTGVTISGTTATISGLAPLSSHKYTVWAVDAAGNKSLKSNMVYASTQSAPVLRYYANGYINSSVGVTANFPLSIYLSAAANPPATFSIVDGPATMTVNQTTGLLEWTPTASDVGTRSIIVQASNSVGSSQLTIPITIAADIPVLSMQFNPNSTTARYAAAGSLFELKVSDASHTVSTYELLSGPSGMTIDSNTGLVQWTPTVADAGQTTLTVRATNSAGSTEATITFETFFTESPTNVQVSNLTALHPTATWTAPTGEGAQEITGYSLYAVAHYRTGRYHRTHTVRLDSPGTGTSIELTGLLTGKTYNLIVNAYNADGERGALGQIAAPFIATPALPVIGWTVTNPNGDAIVANQPVVIQLTNYNADPATFSLVNGPAGMTVDPNTGLANWLPSASDVGSLTATFRATNSVGPRDIVVPINVLFSGSVTNVTAIVTNGTANVSWAAPTDNVEPVDTYLITMHWTWSGRSRSRSVTVPGSALSTTLALIPTGAVWHRGVTITPIDSLGRAGASTLLVPYIT